MESNNQFSKIAEPAFVTASFLMGFAALGNLALSQIHIGTITKVFAPEVGFYFFLYIIFGLVTFMNTMNMKKPDSTISSSILLAVFAIAVTIAGSVYIKILLDDVATENLLTQKDINLTLVVAIVSMIIYLVGSLTVLITEKAYKRGI